MSILKKVRNKIKPYRKGELPVGIVGIGGWGNHFLRRLAASKLYDLKVCYDKNQNYLEEASRKYKFIPADSYEDLISNYEIEAVFIVVPNKYHYNYALKAADKGIDIFLEKPISNTYDEAKKIIDICNEKKVKLCVGHSYRKLDAIQHLKRLIFSDKLGDVHLIEANRSMAKAIAMGKKDWRFFYDQCPAAPLLQLGIHYLDIMIYLFGEPVKVFSLSVENITDTYNLDALSVLLKFNDSMLGYLGTSYATENISELKILGTRGVARLTNKQLTLISNGKERVIAKSILNDDVISKELLEFYAYLTKNIPVDIDGDNGLKVIRIFERIVNNKVQ